MRLLLSIIIVACISACSGEAPGPEATSPPDKLTREAPATFATYDVLFGGTNVGALTVTENGTKVSIDFGFSNNGRGASSQETILRSETGIPISWTITGKTTFGNQVNENFEMVGGRASWSSAAGSNNAEDSEMQNNGRKPLYIAQDPSPYAYYVYAKTVLDAGGKPYPALPSGKVTVTALRQLDLNTDDEKIIKATLYAVGGIDLKPTYVLLDSKHAFLGVVSPRFAVLPNDLSQQDKALRELAASLNSERYENIASNVTHQYEHPVRVNNVHIFNPHTLSLSPLRSVVVTDNTITAIEPAVKQPLPGEVTIEGNGGTVVAGLYDLHGQMGDNQALLNVMAGVTGVRDMGNEDDVLHTLIDKIDSGTLIGPTITKSGFIEGVSDYSAATGELASTKDDALALIREYADKGYWQIKIYNSMNGEWVPDMVKEAHDLGLRVAGHVPAFYRADQMIEAGYDELTHINQIMLGWVLSPEEDTRTLFRITGMKRFADLDLNSEKVRHTLSLMVENNIAHDPTAVIHEYAMTGRNGVTNNAVIDYIEHMPISVQRQAKSAMLNVADEAEDEAYRAAFDKILATLRLMHEKGIFLVPGTDMGGAFYLHRELELFEQIGMSPAEVLKRGSFDMAQYLGHQDRGAIEVGKTADFFLTPGDPTQELKAIKTIAMVVTQGKFFYPTEVYPEFGILPFTEIPNITEHNQ